MWFLGAVALAGLGPAALIFNFHTPAAFVRLFAMAKTLGKYGERVVGHRAALRDQIDRRAGLFAAMAFAPAARARGWQFGDQNCLSDYMDDVESVDNARLRVDLPIFALTIMATLLSATTMWLAPLALGTATILTLVLGASFRSVALCATATEADARSAQRGAGELLSAALASVVPLQAERAFSTVLASAFGRLSDAGSSGRIQRRSLAMLDMLAGLAGPLMALSVLAAAWHAGARGGTMLVPAFLAFGWLATGEMAQGTSRILLGRIRENAARNSLDEWAGGREEISRLTSVVSLDKMALKNIQRRTPDGRRIGEPISLAFEADQPTVLVGASGTGKTTLLKQIAGWIGGDGEGQFIGDGINTLASYRRTISHLGLHDAAILSDTVRENLFAPNATDADCWLALADVELNGRVRDAGGLDAWITQDRLSLGEAQRLNLARALLSRSPVVLLDEPVEHLDAAQAERILRRVLSRLANRIVIYSSHFAIAGVESVHVSLDESAILRQEYAAGLLAGVEILNGGNEGSSQTGCTPVPERPVHAGRINQPNQVRE